MGTRSRMTTARPSTTSATRPSSGWTPTSSPRARSSMRSRRRWRLSATPSSPSCMGQPEVLLAACLTWEAWEVQEELHLELAKEEPAQPLRRLTKSFLGTIVFSWNSNAFMLHFVWNSLEKLNKFYVAYEKK